MFLALIRFLSTPVPASAHGIGERITVPVPLHMYVLGAVVTVALSFVLLGLLSGHLRQKNWLIYELTSHWLGRVLFQSAWVSWSVKLLVLFFTLTVIAAGLEGNPLPSYNIAPVSVWVLLTIGMVYVSSFIGNVWPAIHPVATVLRLVRLGSKPLAAYPVWLSAWPAAVGYVVYRYIENVHPSSSDPLFLAYCILAYSAVTAVGMIAFGREQWLKRADPFGVFFGFLSYFSVLKVDGTGRTTAVKLRPPAVGLLELKRLQWSEITFDMLMLSLIAFDGLKETPAWNPVLTQLSALGAGFQLSGLLSMFLLFGIFLASYYLTCLAIYYCSGREMRAASIASAFAFSLLPIAVGYEVSHFISLFLLESQRAVYLLSDPFGWGWNLFGTAGGEIAYEDLNYNVIWNVQVGMVVLGHVVAVYVAHLRALQVFSSVRIAVRSQYPMLLLMVIYTSFSLWILGQPLL